MVEGLGTRLVKVHDSYYTSVARVALLSATTESGLCVTNVASLHSSDGLNTVPCKIEFVSMLDPQPRTSPLIVIIYYATHYYGWWVSKTIATVAVDCKFSC